MRALRETIGLSQAKPAKAFGISQSVLACYDLDDAAPTSELLLKYADRFDVSMDSL